MNQQPAILLVDDNDNDRFIMLKACESAKFSFPICEVASGEQAIAYLSGNAPYNDRTRFPLPMMMVLDLNMPKKNGFDVLAWLRQQPGLRRLPVLVMTSSVRTEDVERAYELGANAFIVKPSTMEQLISVAGCLDKWIQYNHFPNLFD